MILMPTSLFVPIRVCSIRAALVREALEVFSVPSSPKAGSVTGGRTSASSTLQPAGSHFMISASDIESGG